MTVPPEAGSSAGADDMPMPEMNMQPQPGGTESRPMRSAEASGASDMPIREMNAEPQSRPMSGAEVADTGGMSIREMNAEPQQPAGLVETAHEREKLAAYLRDRQRGQASEGSAAGADEMPSRDMNAPA